MFFITLQGGAKLVYPKLGFMVDISMASRGLWSVQLGPLTVINGFLYNDI